MTTECVVDELLGLRERINETAPVKISVNDFVIMAVAAAFGDVPEANVTWSDEGLVAHASVNVSIAVATDGGLVTPVLRGVEAKRLSAIAAEAQALAQRARDRRLQQHELEGGAFSISNLGMYGTLEFSAIINPPQSGILAVGAARPQAVVVNGAVAVATVMRCALFGQPSRHRRSPRGPLARGLHHPDPAPAGHDHLSRACRLDRQYASAAWAWSASWRTSAAMAGHSGAGRSWPTPGRITSRAPSMAFAVARAALTRRMGS